MRILKVGDTVYENFKPKIAVPVKFDEKGKPIEFQERFLFPIFEDRNQLKIALANTLSWLEKQRVNEILDKYGYIALDDVRYYNSKNPNDPEAKGLLEWYEAYDDAIWNWIDNELPKYQSVEELLTLNLKQIEREIFEKTKSLLPKEED